jgi:hypothetical protein
MTGKLLQGLVSGRFSFGALRDLIGAVSAGTRICSHYMAFPGRAEDFEGWVRKADAFWSRAGNIADLAEQDLARMEQGE